jgi:hypothetical protein
LETLQDVSRRMTLLATTPCSRSRRAMEATKQADKVLSADYRLR